MFNEMFQKVVLFFIFTFANGYRIWIYFIDFIMTSMETPLYKPGEVGISFIFSYFERMEIIQIIVVCTSTTEN